MSFPNFTTLNWGEEKHVATTDFAGLPLGTRGILPDGRVFRYAKAGENITVAALCQNPLAIANHDMDLVIPTTVAVGATSIGVTLGATLATVNQYKDGYVYTNSADGGHIYRIKSHAAVVSGGLLTAVLEDGETVKKAITAGTTEAGLRANPYNAVLLYNTTPDGVPRGVATMAIASGSYAWIQTWGEAVVWVYGTHVVGKQLSPGLTTSGSVDVMENTTGTAPVIGWAISPISVTTDFGHVFLTIAP